MVVKTEIDYKLDILNDFGLTDKAKLKTYIWEQLENCPEEKLSLRLDMVCRNLITAFLDGDRTFVYQRKSPLEDFNFNPKSKKKGNKNYEKAN